MVMKAYSLYKDSCVEWIGEIPNHWDIIKFSYLGRLKSGNGFSENIQGQEIGDFPFYKVSDTNNTGNEIFLNKSNNYVSIQNYTDNKWYLFSKNSIVFPKIGMVLLMNKRRILSNDSFIDNNMMGLKPNDKLFYKFGYYLLTQIDFKDYCSDGTVPSIGESQIGSIKVVIPPKETQIQIGKYLDNKTKKINELMEKTEKKIGLLKEKRVAIINHCVTKGLNPNVEMKDSGVEWIGDIPKHWKVLNGSYIGLYSKGKCIKKDEVVEVGNPCVRYGEIYTEYDLKIDSTVSYISNEKIINSVFVKKGTLLLTGSGETKEEIGKCIVYLGNEILWVGGDIIVIKPKEQMNSLFLSYLINSECIRVQREMAGKGDIIVHIYSKNFKEMKYSIPSLLEQTQIVKYLDKKTKEIDNLIEKEKEKIKFLKEYKQSLISEVVTGKIDVRR